MRERLSLEKTYASWRAAYRCLLVEEPHWDLHVNELIHGYHVQQFEINF